MTTWARHQGDEFFHVTEAPIDGSVPSRCNGRWPESDAHLVETSESPPHDERCGFCQRTVIDPVERGLAELAINAPEGEPIHDRFDLGGEG